MTQITNEYGSVTIDYSPFETHDPTKIGILVSGGADSAYLLYALFKDNQTTGRKFKIVTGHDLSRPWFSTAFTGVLECIRSKFDVDIVSEVIQLEHDTLGDGSNEFRMLQKNGHQLYLDGRIEAHYTGRTSWPLSKDPVANQLRDYAGMVNRFYHPTFREDTIYATDATLSEAAGEETNHICSITGKGYAPFADVDKRFIQAEYKKENLLGDLFPKTISCTGYTGVTAHFTKPCRTCWWCHEKKWAFGMFDGGVA